MTASSLDDIDASASDLRTQVLVAGGGPVGLATAIELAQHGIRSVVIEPRAEVSWLRPRAKTTSARTMEHFRRWGIAAAVRARAPIPQSWSDEVVFCTTLLGREVTRFDHCLGLDLLHDELVAEGGQQAPQPLIELIMREQVGALPDARLLTGWTVVAVEQDDSGVTGRVRDGLGNTKTVRADYLVGCDGPRSPVREAIGSKLEGSADNRPNFNIVFRSQALAARMRYGNAVHYWVLNPTQPGLVGRLDLADQWWCVVMGVDADHGAANPEGLVRNLIGDDGDEIAIEVLATDPWRARMQIADRYRSGRVFLAGDAAHQNPPWGGHGFNTGIGDAVNLGWKLGAVLNNWSPIALLDTYEVERRPVAAGTIAVASQNMATLGPELADPRLIGTDEEFASVRPAVAEATQRAKTGEFHSLTLVLGTAYPDSPIVERDEASDSIISDSGADYRATAAPGHRLPHSWLSDERSLYDVLGPEFSLVGEVQTEAAHRIVDAAQRLGIPLTPVALAREVAVRLFLAPLVLVRPDQHVAWRGSAAIDATDLLMRVTGHAATNIGVPAPPAKE